MKFPGAENRFVHGYENLRVVEDEQQQNLLRTNYSKKSLGRHCHWFRTAVASWPTRLRICLGTKVLVLDAGSLDYCTHTYTTFPWLDWERYC